MGGVTDYVREALDVLGPDASASQVKRWIQRKHPNAPQGQISLALHKLRSALKPSLPVQRSSLGGDAKEDLR
jgi:hypothetical protein